MTRHQEGPIRIGIVGAGLMGHVHARAFTELPDATVTAVYDIDPARAGALADRFAVARIAPGLSQLVEGGDVDAVIVATPFDAHFEPTMDALRAGKHVLVEKPLATDPAEARAMVAEAERARCVLMTGFNLRYEPRYRMVKDWLREEDRGDIVSMYLRRNRRIEDPLVSDIAFENASHDVDVALWLTGRHVERVYAVRNRRAGDEHARGFWSIAEFAGGAVACFEVVWLVPPAVRIERGDAFELIAERGIAHVDVSNNGTSFWQADGYRMRDPILDTSSLNPVSIAMRCEAEDFLRLVRGDSSRTEASSADAVHAVEVVAAMVSSAESGAPVEVERGQVPT